MIDREKWAQIYDIARYNGLSPTRFLHGVILEEVKKGVSVDNEEALYESCRELSRQRTNWPKDESRAS
jgi:hypothetical protein